MKQLILITTIIVSLVSCNSGDPVYTDPDKGFPIESTDKLSRVFLGSNDGVTANITLEEDGWYINNKYKVKKEEFDLLLKTMKNMRPYNRVTGKLKENVIIAMAERNTKVELYDKKGNKFKTFLVGPETEQNDGNFMKMEGSREIYIVKYPGFPGHLSSRFFTQERDWRSKAIFEYQLEEIEKLSIDYHTKPEGSFSLVQNNRIDYDLFMKNPEQQFGKELLDIAKIGVYLNNYNMVHLMAYAPDHIMRDSIMSSDPFCTIFLKGKSDDGLTVDMYYKPVSKRTKKMFRSDGTPMPHDSDVYFGYIREREDFVLLQDWTFGKLLINPTSFIKANSPSSES